MKKYGKLLVLLLTLTMMAALFAGCGNNGGEGTPTNAPTEGTQPTASPTEEPAEKTLKDMTSLEVVEVMGNGINLGNTMEAYGRASYGTDAKVSAYETTWGQPVTTQAMIEGMKAAGFDTIRIPVAWTNTMKYEDGDYTIREDYLDRVGEIIDWAIAADMFVVLNDHWDGGWWGMFGSATEITRQSAMDLYTEMWTQIAEAYKDRDYHLIFESGNEEIGFRLNDKDACADSGSLSDAECYVVGNRINQTFVDTIRATGGNNADRFLLIAGFGTDIKNTCNEQFKMPTDTVKDKLLLSVHYYDPSGYCIFDSIATWGSKQDYTNMNETLAMMQQFTAQGYGIVIGEWGVLFESGTMKENMALYMENFLDNCDLYGYCPLLWDCNNLYNRYQCKVIEEYDGYFAGRSYAVQSAKTLEEIRTQAQADITAATDAAVEAAALAPDEAKAWIMYTSSDWGVQYSVGDTYAPDTATAGIVATDAEITGEGTYTVALDFTGTAAGSANSTTFCAVGIGNGESLFPGYIMLITEVKINGQVIKTNGLPYTTSDDGLCTRVNLYNAWVTEVPATGRTMMGGVSSVCTPCPVPLEAFGEQIKTMEVTFRYIKK